ncbi:MAG: protein BatD [bacterium]|nr:protein BatD [bacterium]
MKRKLLKYAVLFVLTAVLIRPGVDLCLARQNEISVESKVDKTSVTVGELVKYEINIRFTPEMTVAAPPPGINLGGFEIRDYNDKEPVETDGVILKTVEFTIAAYDTGNFVIPPTGILYFTDDTVANTLFTDAVGIRVESILESGTEDILGLKDNLEIPFYWRNTILIASAVLIVIVGAVIGYLYYRKKKRGESLFEWKKEPDKPAHEEAYAALDELRVSDLLKEGRIKEFYIILSDITRLYLQRRYFIPVLEKTTSETNELMQKQNVEDKVIRKVNDLLEESDLVKFAKFTPDNSTSESYLDLAYDIVETTKIIEIDDIDAENGLVKPDTGEEEKFEVVEDTTGINEDTGKQKELPGLTE